MKKTGTRKLTPNKQMSFSYAGMYYMCSIKNQQTITQICRKIVKKLFFCIVRYAAQRGDNFIMALICFLFEDYFLLL